MSYTVEDDVPLEPKNGPSSKYPFASMRIGESFGLENAWVAHSCRNAAHHYCRKHGGKFVVRQYGAGYRCWRVE